MPERITRTAVTNRLRSRMVRARWQAQLILAWLNKEATPRHLAFSIGVIASVVAALPFYFIQHRDRDVDRAAEATHERDVEAARRAAEEARQSEKDSSYLSLGYVSLRSRSRSGSSTDAVATIFLYPPDTSFSNVKLRLRGAKVWHATDGDLSSFLDEEAGGPQAIEFQLTNFKPGAFIVTCLTVPHPRLKRTYRVIQRFKSILAMSGNTPIVEFNQVGEALAVPQTTGSCPAP